MCCSAVVWPPPRHVTDAPRGPDGSPSGSALNCSGPWWGRTSSPRCIRGTVMGVRIITRRGNADCMAEHLCGAAGSIADSVRRGKDVFS